MAANRKTISDSVRSITRNALRRGKLDRAAVRRVTGQAARVASGMLAGIADTLAQRPPRRAR